MSSEALKEQQMIFNPKLMGQSLSEIGMEVINTEAQQVISRWFHGQYDVDVFVWQDENHNVIKQQVCFCGQVAEWNIVEGLRTGLIIESDEAGEEASKMAGNEIILYDDEPQMRALQQAVEVLGFSDKIEEEERKTLVDNFVYAPQMNNMNPKELLQRFGKGRSESSLSFWQKLLKILSW